jgi:peptide/nickel transport system ATP-binding protein
MGTVLKVSGLSIGIRKNKKLLPAVSDISFEVEEGEILGIVGESGCGKSLTALSIAGLLSPPAEVCGGRAVFQNGKDLLGLGEEELCRLRGKELSFVFQEPFSSLNPLMRIGAQIAETLELHSEKDKAPPNRERLRGRVLQMMKKLDLREPEKLFDAYPHQLSGGMCQRAMIALAVIAGPRLLIADEPTTALDLSTQAQILELLKQLNREQGTSILFISHDLGVIRKICGRVLVMYSGRIMEEGPVEEVFSLPAHEYTRGLLGSIPGRNMKGRPLAAIPGRVPSIEELSAPGCPFAPRCPKSCQAPFELRSLGRRKTSCVLGEL